MKRALTRAASAGSSAMAPAAMLFHARGELLALRSGEHFGGVAKGLRDAPGGLLGELEVLGAQCFDRGAVDGVPGERLERLLARALHFLAQRQQVFHRLLHDRREPLLLFIGGVDFDVEVLEHAIEVLVHLSGIERAGHEASAVPAAVAVPLTEGLNADTGGDAAYQRGDRRALEKTTAGSLFEIRGLLRNAHDDSFPRLRGAFPVGSSLAPAGKRDLSGR